MSEHLDYAVINTMIDEHIIGAEVEARDLAADAQRFGAIAVASEVEAGLQLHVEPLQGQIESPVHSNGLKKKLSVFESGEAGMSFKVSYKVPENSVALKQGVDDVNKELTFLSQNGNDPQRVREYVSNKIARVKKEGVTLFDGNTNMVMAGADVPPLFAGQIKEAGSWRDWLASASDEQIVNFSQWYGQRLSTLSDPAKKEAYTKTLETDYTGKIEKAMSAGWINPAHVKHLYKAMNKQKVYYFSPFGSISHHQFGGVREDGTLMTRAAIGLPTTENPGAWVSTHEFGHGFAGIDLKGEFKKFDKSLKGTANEDSQVNSKLHLDLLTVLDEGFNEHMTSALIDGHPTIIDPDARAALGVPERDASSQLYRNFRETFAELVDGDPATASDLTTQDMSRLVDTMANRDFMGFKAFVAQRWNGKDIISEVTERIRTENADMLKNKDSMQTAFAMLRGAMYQARAARTLDSIEV